MQAGDVADQQQTVTVRRETPLVEAFGLMDDIDARSVTVVDADGKPLGYVKRREARGAPGVCADSLHRFRVTARAEENLRVVLSKLYEHNTSGCRSSMKTAATAAKSRRITSPTTSAPAARAGC